MTDLGGHSVLLFGVLARPVVDLLAAEKHLIALVGLDKLSNRRGILLQKVGG